MDASDDVAAGTAIALIALEDGDMTGAGRGHGKERGRGTADGVRCKASPLARKRAREENIALLALEGSGPGGRIIARDVADYAARRAAGYVREDETLGRRGEGAEGLDQLGGYAAGRDRRVGGDRTSAVALRPWHGDFDDVSDYKSQQAGRDEEAALARQVYAPGSYVARPHGSRERSLVSQLDFARRSVPQMTLHADLRLGELERSLKRMNLGLGSVKGEPLSLCVSDVLVKAMGLALRQVPEANVSYTRSANLHHEGAAVAVALVAGAVGDAHGVDDGQGDLQVAHGGPGLVLPVIAHADLKSLSEISREMLALRELAIDGRLPETMPPGGVTTVYDFSDTGISGCETLVRPPQSSVLVLGAVQAKPVVVDGAVVVEPVAQMSLGFDQRAYDMRVALRLIRVVTSYMEDPMRMLV